MRVYSFRLPSFANVSNTSVSNCDHFIKKMQNFGKLINLAMFIGYIVPLVLPKVPGNCNCFVIHIFYINNNIFAYRDSATWALYGNQILTRL